MKHALLPVLTWVIAANEVKKLQSINSCPKFFPVSENAVAAFSDCYKALKLEMIKSPQRPSYQCVLFFFFYIYYFF